MIIDQLQINTDGGARGNPGPAAVGVVASLPDGSVLFQFGQYLGETTNNFAEYQAVVHALNYLLEFKIQVKQLHFVLDSELVVKQIQGLYKVKEPTLQQLHQTINQKIQLLLQSKLVDHFDFTHVKRFANKIADKIVNETLDNRTIS